MKGAILFGGSGRLGQQVIASCAARETPVVALPHAQADVTKPGIVRELAKLFRLQGLEIDTVINCTAFHDTKACEKDTQRAFHMNAYVPQALARQSAIFGFKFVHISTDYVFGGIPPELGGLEGYMTDDAPAPVNVYGASKAAGELLVLSSTLDALVVRVASLFGSPLGVSDFVKLVYSRVEADAPMQVVDDVTMSPTYTRDAAEMIVGTLIEQDYRGIAHVVNAGCAVTWYEFARHIATLVGAPTEFISPITTAESRDTLPRPLTSALVPTFPLPDWRGAVASYLHRLDNPDVV